MLEQILGSATRTRIVNFFCLHSEEHIFVRELTSRLGGQLNSVRRELDNLTKFGLLKSEINQGKKFYFTNKDFALLTELKNLVFKAITLEEMRIANKMSKLSGLGLLIFTGVLSNAPTRTDVLIVGKVKKADFYKYLEKIAEGMTQDLRFTFLSRSDYMYRVEVTDKFIYDILSHEHIVVVDKISKDIKKNQENDFNFKHFRQ
ncbi:hypothetical protein HN670_00415 [bacterium]|jgi:predicted transcriptional regulator|nr:hypothetical protein [bacterium]